MKTQMKETLFQESETQLIKSAGFGGNTLYVTMASGKRYAYSQEICVKNLRNRFGHKFNSDEISAGIRQVVQAFIDDSKRPNLREKAPPVMIRKLQVSPKDLEKTFLEYKDVVAGKLEDLSHWLGSDRLDEYGSERFQRDISSGIMTQDMREITPGRWCAGVEGEDGRDMFFYTAGRHIGEAQVWHRAIDPIIWLGDPA